MRGMTMSPVRAFAGGMAVAAVAFFATALPASAHDELISSDPAADARLDTGPEHITLQFSGELLTLDDSLSGAVVLVVDDEGRDWADGAPVVQGGTVVVDLAPDLPEAGYQVRWQVVSEDGHPISGVVPFTVGDAAPLVAATPTPAGEAESAQEPDESSASTDQSAAETDGAWRAVLIGGGGAALAAALFAAIRILRRSRTAPAAAQDAVSTDAER